MDTKNKPTRRAAKPAASSNSSSFGLSDRVALLVEAYGDLLIAREALVKKCGTDEVAKLNDIVKQCNELDALAQPHAKQAAQELFPKAAAAKQIVGINSVIEHLDHELERLIEFTRANTKTARNLLKVDAATWDKKK